MSQIVVHHGKIANIGDAFYVDSLIEDLRLVYRPRGIRVIPGEAESLYNHDVRLTRKLDLTDLPARPSDVKLLVLSGPILHRGFGERYGKLLKFLREQDIPLAILTAGGLKYDQPEIEHCRSVLKESTAFILSTRDRQTYEAYNDLFDHSYSGICSAFYVSLHFDTYSIKDEDRYVVWGFDKSSEPTISREHTDISRNRIFLEGTEEMKRLRGVPARIVDSLKGYPENIGAYELIRPWHRPLATFQLSLFRRPNVFVSLNPRSYLNVFRNAKLTVSERVHACVPTLSYGKPAMLCLESPRSNLFERLGLTDITAKPVTLDNEKLIEEHNKFINFLDQVPV